MMPKGSIIHVGIAVALFQSMNNTSAYCNRRRLTCIRLNRLTVTTENVHIILINGIVCDSGHVIVTDYQRYALNKMATRITSMCITQGCVNKS